MLFFLYVVQVVICILLILIVMFQKSEGGTSLISSNSYNSFFSSKALVRNPLTKITIILGFVFFFNSVIIGALEIKATKSTDSIVNEIEKISTNNTTTQSKK